jgi:branched-chain amino acid transport system substrate-binding protein
MLRAFVAGFVLLVLSPVRAVAADPLDLDVMLPLTGGAAYAGAAQQQAIRLYEARVNKTGGIHGRPVRFVFHDDQSNPVVAVQIVNQLLPQKPAVILGPSIASTCSAVSPLLAKGPGTVEYCFSPISVPPRGGYVFAATQSARQLLVNISKHLREQGFHRAGFLGANDASGQANLNIFGELLGSGDNASLKMVAQAMFSPTALSVAAEVATIKAANPDVILLYAAGPAFLLSLKELKNAGLDRVPVMTNPFNADGKLLVANADIMPKTLFVEGLPYQARRPKPALRAAGQEYLSVFADGGVTTQSVIQAYCWDPVIITIAALRALPPGANGDQLHDYIENMHGFAGIWGTYDFRIGDNYGLTGDDDPFVRWDVARSQWVPME